MNDRAEEYRRLARECLRLVATVTTEEARSSMIEMARVWARLAEEQETRLISRMADTPQPAIQQQQQLKPKKDGKE